VNRGLAGRAFVTDLESVLPDVLIKRAATHDAEKDGIVRALCCGHIPIALCSKGPPHPQLGIETRACVGFEILLVVRPVGNDQTNTFPQPQLRVRQVSKVSRETLSPAPARRSMPLKSA